MNRVARDLSTAYHEAGHAIVAFRIGTNPRSISIVPGAGYAGVVNVNCLAGISDVNMLKVSPRTQRRIENDILVSLAGPAAQRRFSPRSVRFSHGRKDRENAIKMLSYLCGPSSEELACYYRLMDARAQSAVRNPINWRAIRILAKELIKRRTIKGKALREFILSDCFALPGTKP